MPPPRGAENQQHELLRATDLPALQIYGDGTVRVHRPAYRQQAGDYELRLAPGELQRLLDTLAADGVLDYDDAATRQAKRTAEENERRAGRAFAVTDTTRSIFEIRLDSYTPAGGRPPVARLNKVIRADNVQIDAERLPAVAALGALSRLERTLLQLETRAVREGTRR